MKNLFNQLASNLAPRTVSNLRRLSALDQEFDEGPDRLINYERELRDLRREVDELRRDNRRVAELYDAVFEWVRQNSVSTGDGQSVPRRSTTERVVDMLAEDL